MSKKDEALKLALEALEETLRTLDDENAKPGGAIADTIWYSEHETLFDYLAAQITAIRSALAEQPARQQEESEAVRAAWMAGYSEREREVFERSRQWSIPQTPEQISDFIGSDYVWREHKVSDVVPHEDDQYCVTAHDLISAFERLADHIVDANKMAEKPAQRKPWVGLTDEDHAEVKDVMIHAGVVGVGVAWIENKLREKNA